MIDRWECSACSTDLFVPPSQTVDPWNYCNVDILPPSQITTSCEHNAEHNWVRFNNSWLYLTSYKWFCYLGCSCVFLMLAWFVCFLLDESSIHFVPDLVKAMPVSWFFIWEFVSLLALVLRMAVVGFLIHSPGSTHWYIPALSLIVCNWLFRVLVKVIYITRECEDSRVFIKHLTNAFVLHWLQPSDFTETLKCMYVTEWIKMGLSENIPWLILISQYNLHGREGNTSLIIWPLTVESILFAIPPLVLLIGFVAAQCVVWKTLLRVTEDRSHYALLLSFSCMHVCVQASTCSYCP